jgi:hypothetical protein
MMDGNFDAIMKCVKCDFEYFALFGKLGKCFPANILGSFGEFGADIGAQARLQGLMLHGAPQDT